MAKSAGFAVGDPLSKTFAPRLDLCPIRLNLHIDIPSLERFRNRLIQVRIIYSIICRRDGAELLIMNGIGTLREFGHRLLWHDIRSKAGESFIFEQRNFWAFLRWQLLASYLAFEQILVEFGSWSKSLEVCSSTPRRCSTFFCIIYSWQSVRWASFWYILSSRIFRDRYIVGSLLMASTF
jgi:hypothetical protein